MIPAIAAGGRVGGINDSSVNFEAPPLEVANLAAYGVFLLVALGQLAGVFPALSGPGARLPAAGMAVALTILVVDNALGVALFVTRFTFDNSGQQRFSGLPYTNLRLTSFLFYALAHPAIFAAVSLALYNRDRTVRQSASPLSAFASPVGVLFVIMVALIGVETGLVNLTTQFRRNPPFDELSGRIPNVLYVYFVFRTLGILLLAVSAFIVMARIKKDMVASTIVFAVIPLLLLHALAGLIFAVLEGRLPLPDSCNINAGYTLDFASTLVLGVLYLATMSVLVFSLMRTPIEPPAGGGDTVP